MERADRLYGITMQEKGVNSWTEVIPLFLAVMSALRLAKFNVDERQSSDFIGVATPTAAIICGSLCYFSLHSTALDTLVSSLWFLPAVAVVLSGMTTLEQIRENVETFAAPGTLREEEMAMLADAADAMLDLVPCTACRYCTEGCPKELEIPKLITAYNGVKNGDFMAGFPLDAAESAMDPRRCVGCGACAAVCPQGIDIPSIMADLPALLRKGPHR